MIQDYKDKIISFYQKYKRMPGYQEIMDLTGFKSKNAVYKLINKLVDMGVISKDAKGRLTPLELFDEVPFLGLVEAGMPSVAEESVLDTMNIDSYLIPHKDKTYILEVKGDSMIEAAIQEGDYVIVEKRSDAKDGDIVIAEVDGGWTMKYFRKKGMEVYLQPANKKYSNIYPTESLHIGAIVKAVIRKY
jgi:SOS regulatory protein LexA